MLTNLSNKNNKDLKKIRSVIAKYRTKSIDASSNTIEAKILNTVISIKPEKTIVSADIEIEDEFKNNENFNSANYIENTVRQITSVKIPLSSHEEEDVNDEIDLINFTSNGNIENLLGEVKKAIEYNTNYLSKNNITIENINNNMTAYSNVNEEFTKSTSVLSNITNLSANDTIKKLNNFKNEIDTKIQILKQKMIITKVKLNYQKFKSLKPQAFLNIIYFFTPNDILHMFTLNKEIKLKVVDLFKDLCKILVQSYRKQYLTNLNLEGSLLQFVKTKKNKRLHLQINLILKSKIVSEKLIDKSVAIGYKSHYLCDKENFQNVFKFDVVKPGPISFWIMREYTTFHKDDLNKAYFQHIMKFCIEDTIENTVNIFTEKGLINFSSFKWLQMNTVKLPNMNFLEFTNEHNRNREVIDFDLSRYCELEIIKNKWCELKHLPNHENIFKKIQNLFEPCLIVQKVLFDDVGYLVFKIFLIAIESGEVQSFNELGIKIKVKNSNQLISNETKKNCLIFDRKNELQCRVGDLIIFYISKNK